MDFGCNRIGMNAVRNSSDIALIFLRIVNSVTYKKYNILLIKIYWNDKNYLKYVFKVYLLCYIQCIKKKANLFNFPKCDLISLRK